MFWIIVAVLVTLIGFIIDVLVAKMVIEMDFSPNNVGLAYGVYGAWTVMAVVGLAWYHSGAGLPNSLLAAAFVCFVPFFMTAPNKVRQGLDAIRISMRGLRS